MAGDGSPSGDELNVLRSMVARLRAGERLDGAEVERRLEAGFGVLIGLEAELARVQRASASETPAAQADASADLKHQILELSEVLTDLRTLTASRGESRVGYGFVLPDNPQQSRARSN